MVWQVKLCCQDRTILALHLDMQVRRSAGVLPWQQCLQQKSTSAAGVLMTPQVSATVVVAALIVALPEIEKHTRYWAAGAVQYLADKLEAGRFCLGLDEAGSLRREWRKEGALHLGRSLTATSRGRWLLSQRLPTGQDGRRGQPEVKGKPPKALKYFSTRGDGLFHEISI